MKVDNLVFVCNACATGFEGNDETTECRHCGSIEVDLIGQLKVVPRLEDTGVFVDVSIEKVPDTILTQPKSPDHCPDCGELQDDVEKHIEHCISNPSAFKE